MVVGVALRNLLFYKVVILSIKDFSKRRGESQPKKAGEREKNNKPEHTDRQMKFQ